MIVDGEKAAQLAKTVQYIRSNLHRPLDLASLAKLANMSYSHFSKIFKLQLGVAPHQFILRERVAQATRLLRETKTKIVEIAFAVGFESQAHFTTVFRKLVGVTPRRFRKLSNIRLAAFDELMTSLGPA
jgi:AraC family transcriptional regulator